MKESVKKNLFSKKILYLFNILEENEDEFIKLFWNHSQQPSLRSREKTVRSWLKKDIEKPKAFKFDTFKISQLTLENEEPAFTKESFLEESFEDFQERVLNYIEAQKCSEDDFEYNYMYYYDNFLEEINFLELSTLQKINNRSYKIELLLPEEYNDREKYSYIGELKIDQNYYYISVKNNFEILTYYYRVNSGLKNNDTCYGLRLGKAYDDGSPLCAKNLLTKRKLTAEEKLELYLNINETEEIKLKEDFNALNNSSVKNFYSNFYQKIEKLFDYVNNSNEILKEEIYSRTFTNIMNQEFIAFGTVAKKVEDNNSFHINNIRRASKVFLQSLQKGEHCFLVSPLNEKLSILNEDDIKAQKSLRLNIETAKSGVHLHRIFIIKQGVTFTDYMKVNIKKMIRHGINVRVAKQSDVESIVGLSYDFVISEKSRVSIYQRPKGRSYIYHVSKNLIIKDDLTIDYKKILDKSLDYYEYIEKSEEIDQSILEKLQGEFHHYTYGSKVDQWGRHYFWNKRRVTINSEGKVHYFENDSIIAEGKVVIHKNQTCLGLIKKGTDNTIVFTIDNCDVNFSVLKVITTAKQYMEDGKDIISIGIFSRQPLEETVARELIGEEKYAVLLVDSDIKSRIANFVL